MQKHLVPVNYATGTSGDVVALGLSLVSPRGGGGTREEERRRDEGTAEGGRGHGSCSGYWWQGSRSFGGGFQEKEIEGGEVEVEVRKASPSQHGAMV